MAMNSENVIEIKNLIKSFGDNHVLKGFNLTLRKGENVAVMGKSGSGKSVMIKCAIGLIEYEQGSIKVLGKEIKDTETKELDEIRTEVGFLFQSSALYDSMTVKENLEFPLRRHLKKMEGVENTDALIVEALQNVGLEEAIDLYPEELSGGMKRRIALARTLILKPSVILYDEPTAGLDPITSKEISMLMKSIQQKYNTSSIVITHDVECAKVTAEKIILLVDGVNYAEGTYQELIQSDDSKITAFFKSYA
jgi:phospholipid/cholesterol/gamma-HCH transport system ATP-binding protein